MASFSYSLILMPYTIRLYAKNFSHSIQSAQHIFEENFRTGFFPFLSVSVIKLCAHRGFFSGIKYKLDLRRMQELLFCGFQLKLHKYELVHMSSYHLEYLKKENLKIIETLCLTKRFPADTKSYFLSNYRYRM